MGDTRPFHFKHFSLFHHRSTMKVGTDAVLLGRWVDVNEDDVVLDIGTGCGILPLMLMQRGVSCVDAVDLDAPSVAEASENFACSQWASSLHAIHADVKDYARVATLRYDLIVSNPPFFIHSYKASAERKNQARHTDFSLSFSDLITSVVALLKPTGRFAVVLPVNESAALQSQAESLGLSLIARQEIVPVEGRTANRYNMLFAFGGPMTIKNDQLVIRDHDGRFTSHYNEFLSDFYLGL